MTAAVDPAARTGRARAMRSSLAVEWREVGGLGRLATVGLVASGVVAVALGLSIEASVHRHLLEVRTELLQRIVDDMEADGIVPLGPNADVPADAVDAGVEHSLIGGEVVDVAIRDRAGATVFGAASDATTTGVLRDGTLPHAEQHSDGLLHFVLPVDAPDGGRLGSFEVYQESASFNDVLDRVRRNVWLSISTGLATLGIAMGSFTSAHARVLDRRRRRAEQLLRELLLVEDRERHRIVGALHDDVGQPLYRVLYGLEGCRARMAGNGDLDAELSNLITLVRDVDGTLRTELRGLHRPSLDELDLVSALEAAAGECRTECGLEVETALDVGTEPPPLVRSVLVRAVHEALLNVRKHAQASAVRIVAVGNERQVVIDVVDDGIGPSAPPGLGLTTATERLESVGGGLRLWRLPTGRTALRMWAPVDAGGTQ